MPLGWGDKIDAQRTMPFNREKLVATARRKRGRLQPSSRAERDFSRRGAATRTVKPHFAQKNATNHKGSPRRGAPGGTRTPDLLVRSQTLYPAELLAHGLFSNSLIIISAKRKNVKRFLQVFEILLKRSRRGKGRERFPGFRPAAGFLPPCLSRPLKCSGDGCCG